MKGLISYTALSLALFVLAFPASAQRQRTKRTASKATTAPARPAAGGNIFGSLDGNSYKNDVLGISVFVPEGYTVLNRAEIDVYTKAGADIIKPNGGPGSKAIDEAVANSASLLIVAKKPPGSAANSIFEMLVRKQKNGVTANMVLAESVRLMSLSTKAVLTKSLGNVRLARRTFVGAAFELNANGQKLKHRFLTTMHRGYALSIGLTYAVDADTEAFDKMLADIVIPTK